MTIQNRIKEHRRVRAGDLIPNEYNPRIHTPGQRKALEAIYSEVGFARSLLAYELPEGGLKLIDGHLRQSLDPDQVVEVEILDVNDEEAKKLLLSIDPLAALAGTDEAALAALRSTVHTDNDALRRLWDATAKTASEVTARLCQKNETFETQYWITIKCSDETELDALLHRLKSEGLNVEARIA